MLRNTRSTITVVIKYYEMRCNTKFYFLMHLFIFKDLAALSRC